MVIVLRYVEDVDVDTVAALLGISPGTVKSQIGQVRWAWSYVEIARGSVPRPAPAAGARYPTIETTTN